MVGGQGLYGAAPFHYGILGHLQATLRPLPLVGLAVLLFRCSVVSDSLLFHGT